MKTTRLSELQVEYFRGATNRVAVSFDAAKPLVVVFGENGTGKSTLVDALDLIANDQIGSLQDRSSTSNSHAPTIGKKPADVKVSLTRGTVTWKGTLKGKNPQVSPPSNRPVIEILRRSHLLRLVEAAPGKRYEALQRFIDVAGVEASENELDRASKAASQEVADANRRHLDAEEELNGLWETNGKPGDSWQAWAQTTASLNTAGLDGDIASFNSLLESCDLFTRRKNDHDAAISTLSSAVEVLTGVVAERQSLQSAWTEQTPFVIDTLTATTALLGSGWNQNTCPVCEQAVVPSDLRERVSEALDSMKALKAVHDRERSARLSVAAAQQIATAERTKLLAAVGELLKTFSANEPTEMTELALNFEQLSGIAASDNPSEADWADLLQATTRLAALRESLDSARNLKQRDRNQLHTVQRAIKEYREAIDDATTGNALELALKAILSQVREVRIQFVQGVLNSVSQEAERLYQIIHPREHTKSGRLALDPGKRASLLQYVEFAGHADVEPQPYFSDSHLDTLGFCYWLALAKRASPTEKIIVLDDVFTSVDVAHLGRIVDLLDAECGLFAQMFVLTHNRNWFDRYRYNQAVSGKAHLVELLRWTPTVGVRHSKTKLELDELSELAVEFADVGGNDLRQRLASRCGVFLESLLGCISKQYRGSVPHTADGLYTLSDLLGSCTKALSVLEIHRFSEPDQVTGLQDCEKVTVKSELAAVKALAVQIRNGVGCHFNQVAAQLSDSEVGDFVTSTLGLATAIICPNPICGQIPQKQQGGFYECGCKRTRLVLTKQI